MYSYCETMMSLSLCVCERRGVYLCVCVRERERDGDREKESFFHVLRVSVCGVYSSLVLPPSPSSPTLSLPPAGSRNGGHTAWHGQV